LELLAKKHKVDTRKIVLSISKEYYDNDDLIIIEENLLKRGFSIIICLYDCDVITLNKIKNNIVSESEQSKEFNTISVNIYIFHILHI